MIVFFLCAVECLATLRVALFLIFLIFFIYRGTQALEQDGLRVIRERERKREREEEGESEGEREAEGTHLQDESDLYLCCVFL